MGKLPHRIFRQQWQVTAESEAEAFSLRKQIRERWEDTIVPVFEKAFDDHSNGDEMIYIPKMEIKLKVSGNEHLWESISSGLYHQLSDLLGSDQTRNSTLSSGRSEGVRIPAKLYRFEVLIHYLQTGNLPWQEDTEVKEVKANISAAISDHRGQLIDFLQNYKATHVVLFRLFQLLPDDEIFLLAKDLCSHLSNASKDQLNNLIIVLLQPGDNGLNSHLSRMIMASLVEAGISHCDSNADPDWFKKAEQLVPSETMVQLRRHLNPGSGHPIGIDSDRIKNRSQVSHLEISENLVSESENSVADNDSASEFNGLTVPVGHLPNEGKMPEHPEFSGNLLSGVTVNELSGAGPFRQLQFEERFMVQNAGLLLLHPFMSSFFMQTGVLSENKKAIPPYHLSNAAALLHYLATGRDEVYEFEIGFVKLLLGLEPDQSLPVSAGTLSQAQKDEAESLLTAVVGHWNAIKNTSVSGLRESFIQRGAMIYRTEDGWKVQPESRSYDMLLNTIPWSFSIIRFPWMEKLIYTEWQTN